MYLMLIAVPDDHALEVMAAGIPGGCMHATVQLAPNELTIPIDALTKQILHPMGVLIQHRWQDAKLH